MPTNDPWAAFPSAQDPTPKPPAELPTMPLPQAQDPWSAFPAAASERSTAADVGAGAVKGLVRGAVNAPLMPLHLARLLKSGIDTGLDAVMESGYDYVVDPAIRAVTQQPSATPAELADREAQRKSYKDFRKRTDVISRGLDYGNSALDSGLNNLFGETKTAPGRLSETVGEFAVPGQVFGGGSTKVAKFVGDTVVPAVGAWGAGELTDQSPWAKFFGSLLGSGITGLVRENTTAPQQLIKSGVNKEMVSPEQFSAAKQLQQEAAARGVNLSGDEALNAVTNGGTGLSNIARVASNSQAGGSVALPFYAKRPEQVDSAVSQSLDNIAAPSPNPDMLGAKIRDSAEAAITKRVEDLNASTRPLYQAAEPQLTGVDTSTPAFQITLKQLRGNPVLGPEFAKLPDDSVAVIDAVSKLMKAKADTLSNPAGAQGLDPLSAAIFSKTSGSVRDAARQAVPDYDAALTAQQAGRAADIDPMAAGPVGRVADVQTPTTPAVADAFLPKDANVQRVGPTRTSFERAQMARQDQPSYDQFMRQVLDNARNEAGAAKSRNVMGKKFVDDVAGNDAQRASLMEALGATSNGPEVAKDIGTLLDVLNATRFRPQMNSMTQANTELAAAAKTGPALSTFTNFVVNPKNWTSMSNDIFQRYWYGQNLKGVAEILYGPQSVQKIEDIVMGRTLSSNPESLLANTVQRAKQSVGPAAIATQTLTRPKEEKK